MGPIGSAVLTFIGYKQTDKQTDKPNLYIDINDLANNNQFTIALNQEYRKRLKKFHTVVFSVSSNSVHFYNTINNQKGIKSLPQTPIFNPYIFAT